jgi:hypothetical protein
MLIGQNHICIRFAESDMPGHFDNRVVIGDIDLTQLAADVRDLKAQIAKMKIE